MQLSTIGQKLMNETCGDPGREEWAAVDALLRGLDTDTRLQIDGAVGALVSATMEAAFLAGVQLGRDPLSALMQP